MQYDRELTGNRDDRSLVAESSLERQPPPLDRGIGPRSGENRVCSLVKVGPQVDVTLPRDPAGDIDLPRLVAGRRQTHPGADRPTALELLRSLDRGDIGECRDGPDTWGGQQKSASSIPLGDSIGQAVQRQDLAANGSPHLEQGLDHHRQLLMVGQAIADR